MILRVAYPVRYVSGLLYECIIQLYTTSSRTRLQFLFIIEETFPEGYHWRTVKYLSSTLDPVVTGMHRSSPRGLKCIGYDLRSQMVSFIYLCMHKSPQNTASPHDGESKKNSTVT